MSKLAIGSADIKAVLYSGGNPYHAYVGSTEVWNRYLVEQSGTLSAADEAAWSSTGTFTRENSDTEFRLVASGAVRYASIDLWDYVSDGDVVDIAIDLVSVDGSDETAWGLSSSPTSSFFTAPFSGSPYNNAAAGTKWLSTQTINSGRRYLKMKNGNGHNHNFNNVRIWLT